MQQEIFSDGTSTGSTLDSSMNATLNTTSSSAAAAAPPGTWGGWLVNKLCQVLLMGGLLVGVVVYNLWRNQDKMLYHPQMPDSAGRRVEHNRPPFHSPLDPKWGGGAGLPFTEAFVASSDGTLLHAWLLSAPPSVSSAQAPTLVLCHANAGNIGHRLPLADGLRALLGANIVLWDYRGYGASQGEPEEEGIKRDGEAVLAWVRKHPGIHQGRVFVMGESLGGAVAVHMAATAAASQPPLAGLLLLNTFTSISDMVDHLLPTYKLIKPYILRLRWDSRSILPRVACPILLASGRKDTLVPPALMDALRSVAEARGLPGWMTQMWQAPEGNHNDTPMMEGLLEVGGGGGSSSSSKRLGFFHMAQLWVEECLRRSALEGSRGGAQAGQAAGSLAGGKGQEEASAASATAPGLSQRRKQKPVVDL